MKTFTATPEEFATGHASRKAVDIIRGRAKPRPPRPKRLSKPHGPSQERQLGTVSPEDFAVGRPYWGHRAYGHRTEPVPKMKPLPEEVVDALLK